MKALSLKQPFAELILSGKKSIELRNWNTSFRGEFFIHASKIPDARAMKRFGFSVSDLPRGALVGKTTLCDMKHYKTKKEHAHDKCLPLADTSWGNYGFVLTNVKRLPKPIPMKGKLGFWEVN